ncbi:MAG: molybdopterin-dependent oxidoreductase [Deltaproteobacteria bacterium]|nr:molybdopterin-dependent oxidoreductase [Deltaproteobacteria bacterium]
MKRQVSVSCPMDCWDLCRFVVTVEKGQITKFEGDRHHPVTKGFTCKKGRALVQRLYHPERIRHPLVKKNGTFVEISYEEVFDIIIENLISIKKNHGTRAILNYTSDGYGGLKNRVQTIFFNCFGGVTQPVGSLCWGAGIAAQIYDFGSPKGHFPDDILNSDTILVWGRNPKYTSIHLYALLKKAQKKGSRIMVIDPLKTATAREFDEYIRIRPSTDGALALAMASTIIENNLHDKKFIEKYVLGFDRFKAYASFFTLEKAEKITGISAETIGRLALQYAKADKASIYVGYGLQRYHNGGSTVRCIDALGAITGKIGKTGCGVNYAARSISPYLYDLDQKSRAYAENRRVFTIGNLGRFLESAKEPHIKAVFVACANPLTQSPDLERTVKNFSRIEFKVVFDHFMTDTARLADIVIPAASVFEQDDFFVTSMYSHVLNYSQKAVDPLENIMPECEFYLKLAEKLGMKNLGFKNSEDYLKKSVQPLLERLGKGFDQAKVEYLRIKEDEIAWKDKAFETPSGKIELYSEKALKDGLSPLPEFIKPDCGSDLFPLRLLTCHTIDSMHSQGFAFNNEMPVVYLNRKTARTFEVENKTYVFVKGKRAKLKAQVRLDESICDDIAFIYQGFWHKSGAVNYLTKPVVSDMGNQAAFYDSFCTIEKIRQPG